jgi:hypothetical protein
MHMQSLECGRDEMRKLLTHSLVNRTLVLASKSVAPAHARVSAPHFFVCEPRRRARTVASRAPTSHRISSTSRHKLDPQTSMQSPVANLELANYVSRSCKVLRAKGRLHAHVLFGGPGLEQCCRYRADTRFNPRCIRASNGYSPRAASCASQTHTHALLRQHLVRLDRASVTSHSR